jgi:acyl-CoA thioester hydrolase
MVPCHIRVIYGDTDQMGVVYYANYFRYFEAGRNEFLRARGIRYAQVEQDGLSLPVIEARCLYRKSARYDDLLVVETTLAEIHRASLRFEYRLRRDGEEGSIATGFTVHVCLDRAGKPARIPKDLAARLLQKS